MFGRLIVERNPQFPVCFPLSKPSLLLFSRDRRLETLAQSVPSGANTPNPTTDALSRISLGPRLLDPLLLPLLPVETARFERIENLEFCAAPLCVSNRPSPTTTARRANPIARAPSPESPWPPGYCSSPRPLLPAAQLRSWRRETMPLRRACSRCPSSTGNSCGRWSSSGRRTPTCRCSTTPHSTTWLRVCRLFLSFHAFNSHWE